MKKIIGIIAREDRTIDNNPCFIVNKNIISMLNNYNVIPLIITPRGNYNYYGYNIDSGPKNKDDELKDMLTLVDKCDGIILQGGDEFYQHDVDIVKYLYQKNIPTLGICLGMQTMGYTFCGIMKDISNHKDTNHEIIIDKDSLLYKIIGKDKIIVNSSHKSSIDNTDLFKGAYSIDGIIEEIEDKTKTFFMGLQWHPERILNEDQKKIIEYFIDCL